MVRTPLPHARRTVMAVLVAALAVSLSGCAAGMADPGEEPEPETVKPVEIVLASTTSTQDSGLFDDLIPAFEDANPGYRIKVVAVGTGEALKLGETKDADVLLVHAKADEEKFVAAGFGTERKDVMYNDFVIVGPPADPAGVMTAVDLAAAMQAIAGGKAQFVSRGDDSGTHNKERKLWAAAGISTPTPVAQPWYLSTGQGMGETLKVADEKLAYTIADRATFLTMSDAIGLEIAREGDKDLLNQYGVIVVAEARNQSGGQVFSDWIVSAQGQKVIGEFGVETYGQQLFVPNAQ